MGKNITTDEKFISIEYDKWVKKYQPMENQIVQLKNEIEELKNQHTIKVELEWNADRSTMMFDHNYGDPRYNRVKQIGTIDPKVRYWTNLEQLVTPEFIKDIRDRVDGILRAGYEYAPGGVQLRQFVLRNDHDKAVRELKLLESQKSKSQEAINKTMQLLREEIHTLELERKAIILPRFFKWLQKVFLNV